MRVNISSRKDFQNLFRDLSEQTIVNGNETEMILSPQYGKGSIRTIDFSDFASIAITDICINDGIEISYEIPIDHFQIECCLDGCMRGVEYGKYDRVFEKNNISFAACNSSTDKAHGKMVYIPRQSYKGVVFAFETEKAPHYFGHSTKIIWDEAINNYSKEPCFFNSVNALPSIVSAFSQIQNKFIRNKSDILFFDSKISEIIALTTSLLLDSSQPNTLDEYESAQIRKVKSILMANLSDPPAISDLAGMFGLNKNKLQDGFRVIYGDTIYSYYRKMRLDYAKTLLQTKNMSVEDIAYTVGYKSVSQFRTAFKNVYGFSPSEFRAIH